MPERQAEKLIDKLADVLGEAASWPDVQPYEVLAALCATMLTWIDTSPKPRHIQVLVLYRAAELVLGLCNVLHEEKHGANVN